MFRPQRISLPILLLTVTFTAAPTVAGVSSDQPGAILVFPKVVSDASRDTIIQMSNATGTDVSARCFYTNSAIDPDTGQPGWLVTDFQTKLTRMQPTHWVAGDGLPVVAPPDWQGRPYPGPIPPVGVGFIGELRCVVVDQFESPISKNALTGEATLIDRVTHATRKYQAVSIEGLANNNGDNTLLLNDAEYSTCPRMLLLNHFFAGAADPILGSPVESSLTLVPCSMDLERTVPGAATLQLDVFNEFEERSSASIAVTCFADFELSSLSVFNFAVQGTLAGQTRIRPLLDADTSHGHGVLGIAEEFRDAHATGSALNVHFIEGNLQSDVIVLPSSF